MSKVKPETTFERFGQFRSIFLSNKNVTESFRARVSYDLCAGGDNGDDDESVVNRFRFVSKFPRSFALSLDEGKSFF